MGKDFILGFAALIFAVLLYVFASSRPPGESAGPSPDDIASGKAMGRATLRPTWAVDLESGGQEDATGPWDVRWEAKTESERCLCPALNSKALFAPLSAEQFDGFNTDIAAGLIFSERGLRHADDGGEVASGFAFAVRTAEGRLARARVVRINAASRNLTLEWQMLPGIVVGDGNAASGVRNATVEAQRLLDEALENIRSGNPTAALGPLNAVTKLVDEIPPGSEARIALLVRLGHLYWSVRSPEAALAVTTRAVTEIDRHGGPPLPWNLTADAYRWMGVLHRDMGNAQASIPWHERALEVAQNAKARDGTEAGMKSMDITTNLLELKDAECRTGNRVKGEHWLQELKQTCAALPGAKSIGACNPDRWSC